MTSPPAPLRSGEGSRNRVRAARAGRVSRPEKRDRTGVGRGANKTLFRLPSVSEGLGEVPLKTLFLTIC